MSSVSNKHTGSDVVRSSKRVRNIAVFAVCAIAWLVFDIASKQYFTQAFAAGEVTDESVLGIFQFTLVHNTGAAWGIFGNSTEILALVSLVVTALILVYFAFISPRANMAEALGLALVVAGGVGNAIDRFLLGYVVDFIEFSFIDFPVFNIADMGVTCGFVLFFGGLVYSWLQEDRLRKQADNAGQH